MEEQLKYRSTLEMLPRTIKIRLKQYCNTNQNEENIQRVRASGRCAFCDRARDRTGNKSLHYLCKNDLP